MSEPQQHPMVLSSVQQSALHKLEKYRRLELGADDLYRAPGRFWAMESKLIRQLVARDLARCEVIKGRTFAVAVTEQVP